MAPTGFARPRNERVGPRIVTFFPARFEAGCQTCILVFLFKRLGNTLQHLLDPLVVLFFAFKTLRSLRLQHLIRLPVTEEWGQRNFFNCSVPNSSVKNVLRLYSIARPVIERHIKVREEANPYDPQFTGYFERRRCFAWRTLPCGKAGQVLSAGV